MLGALLGAAGSALSGLLGKNQADKNIKLQKDFAQHGITWKVEDAKRAGLHPLAALGAQTTSFSPIQVGSDFSQAGQDLGRALQAKQTESSKEDNQLRRLQVERAGLENTLLASQIAKYNQPGQPPSMPSMAESRRLDGQGNSPLIKREPLEVTTVDPRHPGQEPAALADAGWTRDADGNYAIIPSKEVKDRIEDSAIYETQHAIRNQLVPPKRLEPFPAPYGSRWRNNVLTGRWWLEKTRRPLPQHGRWQQRR